MSFAPPTLPPGASRRAQIEDALKAAQARKAELQQRHPNNTLALRDVEKRITEYEKQLGDWLDG